MKTVRTLFTKGELDAINHVLELCGVPLWTYVPYDVVDIPLSDVLLVSKLALRRSWDLKRYELDCVLSFVDYAFRNSVSKTVLRESNKKLSLYR